MTEPEPLQDRAPATPLSADAQVIRPPAAAVRRGRRADGIATGILTVIGVLMQLVNQIVISNIRTFAAEFDPLPHSTLTMLKVLSWGGWLLAVAGFGALRGLRNAGVRRWPWALLLVALLVGVSIWATSLPGVS